MFARDSIWLSLGENCLPDDILKRHGLKAFSTPFSSGRTNIDYAMQADYTDFSGLLDRGNLRPGKVGQHKVLWSTLYGCDEIFCSTVSRGFEITHHDVVKNVAHRASWERKIRRWVSLRESGQPVAFLYLHRKSSRSNLDLLIEKLEAFCRAFSRGRLGKCTILLMHQTLVGADTQRAVKVNGLRSDIAGAEFFTHAMWSGDNVDQFWARWDDDLIIQALRAVGAALETQDALWTRAQPSQPKNELVS